jgi:pimeloyl-ACP methyl ester carboxylesterase
MAQVPPPPDADELPLTPERIQQARVGPGGHPIFDWALTSCKRQDIVRLVCGPFDVLPVIFVPGIMGSNLKSTVGKEKGKPVWRLDTGVMDLPTELAKQYTFKKLGERQQLLHPDRCEVDDGGSLPKNGRYSESVYKEMGWGEVGEGPYQEYLLWLDGQLNPAEHNPALWRDYYQDQATVSAPLRPGEKPSLFPGIRMGMRGQPFGAEKGPFEPVMTDELMKRAKFMMPVYAFGYNWLASNDDAADRLQRRIKALIRQNNQGSYRCEQVLLVTHSMGGLVARACAQLEGMEEKIAGIVHGVMPANGAAVAYRRCKVGMDDESFAAGLVIGSTGQAVTAVFAQAPGALQLLPSHGYGEGWLRVDPEKGQPLLELPKGGTAYDQIYRERKQWWGLVNEAWLSPKDGEPITWEDYKKNLRKAEQFHAGLVKQYHPASYVIYGADAKQQSFEKVTWRVRRGLAPGQGPGPGIGQVTSLAHGDIRRAGATPGYVGGQTKVMPNYFGGMPVVYETSYWELHCEKQDSFGDGTVPARSGAAPLAECRGAVCQQFQLDGFAHEPAYKNAMVQQASLYAINKIVGKAKVPA